MNALLQPQVVSVNAGRIGSLAIEGRSVATAIRKRSVSTQAQPDRVAVQLLGLAGDEQADLSVHGGLSKAVYAYPYEHYGFWQTVRAQGQAALWDEELPYGALGENLTITGLLEQQVWIGDVLRFPDCVLAVSEPRQPCFKFQAVMGFKHAVKMMAQSAFCGFYLAVRVPGTIAAGECGEVIPGAREVNIRELFMAKMRKQAR